MSNCKKLPYFEGLTDETIKQGSNFDLTEGVTAYDGNDEEIGYSTSPTNAEFDTCDVGSHVIQYHAGQPVDRFLPNICLGTDLAVSIPSYCDNYESVTKERLIRIIQAANPSIYGIPHVTIAQNTPFDPLNGVSAVDDNGNTITDIEYSGYLDKRVTGNPITITDGQSVVPVKSLEVELEPIQPCTPWMGTEEYNNPYLSQAMPQMTEAYNTEYLKKIVGGTVAWNQLAELTSNPATTRGITFSMDTSGTVSLSGTSEGGYSAPYESVNVYANHKYLILTTAVANPNSVGVVFGLLNVPYATATIGQSKIIAPQSDANSSAGITGFLASTNLTGIKYKGSIIDLTQMFGSTIADALYAMEQAESGSGVSWFRKYFPKPYYQYDAGSLQSVHVASHDMVGFNMWDEELENGSLNATTGVKEAGNNYFRTKNFISVLPNTTYYYKAPTSSLYARIYQYDADYNFIKYEGSSRWLNGTFTTESNAHYIKFTLDKAVYGTTYNHDICINLSWSGWRNGEYEPYQKHSYPLDSSLTLRGIPKLDAQNNLYYDGDEYEADGTVTRKYGIVDLGTLTDWRYFSEQATFYATLDTKKVGFTNVVCAKYATRKANSGNNWNLYDKEVGGASNAAYIYVKDSTYTDVTAFKSAMSGVYLVYELETPTTETADSYTSAQTVDPSGMEEFVSANIVPVGHVSSYARVCPISGYTEVNTQRVGKNLWDDSIAPTNIGAYTLSGNAGTVQGRNLYLPNGTYTFSYNGTTTTYLYGNVVNADGSWVSTFQLTIGTITRTPSFTLSDGQYAKLYVASGSVSDMTSGKIQLELGSTATAYEPYQGTTYTTDLGRTVYGGTLDVVSGELVVDRAMMTVNGSESGWSNYSSSDSTNVFRLHNAVDVATIERNQISSQFVFNANAHVASEERASTFVLGSSRNLYVQTTKAFASDVESFKSTLAQNPLQLVYELATPQTIQLSPQQVMLLTGGNNLWSDGTINMVYSTEVPTEGDITYPLEGEYTLTYRVTDKCGNVGEATRQITVLANEVQSVQNAESEVSE